MRAAIENWQRQKNPHTPAKRRMKASHDSSRTRFRRLASSFSLTEKSAAHPSDHDERSYVDILTPDLTSLPPSQSNDQWQWESVTRYSGATVPDSHGVPKYLAAKTDRTRARPLSKSTDFGSAAAANCQAKFSVWKEARLSTAASS